MTLTGIAHRFRDFVYRTAQPSWMTTGESELVQYSLGVAVDGALERMRLSYEAGNPTTAPEDALRFMGRDRRIRRGRSEPAASYAVRLVRYLDDHKTQGNPFALMDQLYAYLQTAGVTLRTVDRRGNWFTRAADGTRGYALNRANWDWDGGALTSFTRFWVVIYSDTGPWTAQWLHGTPGAAATSGTTTATADEIAGVMAIVKEWKPAGTRCEWVIVSFAAPGGFLGPETGDDPAGAWGDWADATYRPVRDSRARYWRGPR